MNEGTPSGSEYNLLGIDRRIAYANRKYHSGWILTGVTSGFAGVKLSWSLRIYGSFRVNTVNIIIIIANPNISFTVKYGWNGILSVFLFSPSGLFDPVWCRNRRWISTIPAIANGIRKSCAKNRVNVASVLQGPTAELYLYLCLGVAGKIDLMLRWLLENSIID
jgi:hypothetical protein